MKIIVISKMLLFSAMLPAFAADPALPNTLTSAEKAAGWRLLWNGQNADGWRSAKSENFPVKGWEMTNGVLTVLPSTGGESTGGGDIITRERFSEFELWVDFKITPGANSGVKYFVQPKLAPIDKVTGKPAPIGSAIGLEFQILDDLRHPDAKLGKNGDRTIGSLYDLIPAAKTKPVNPIGEWNTARIVISGKHVEHWLNGVKVLEYERGSESYRKRVAESKYKNIPEFGEWADGHILLQDHGNRVSFRNIKIRVLAANHATAKSHVTISPAADDAGGSSGFYSNPVYADLMPDPSVVRHGDYYYAAGTTGQKRTADGRIFTLLKSRDLVHWERLGGALNPPFADSTREYWAPELTSNGGKFYLYYCEGGIEPEKFALHVAISDRPEGPYNDAGKVLADGESNRFTIDPFPFRDEDGKWYLFYARNFTNFTAEVHPGTAIVVDRLVNMTQLAGDCRVVVRATHDWTLYEAHRKMDVYGQTFDWHTIEGPCVLKHAGRYYCFYSGANWQTPRYGVDYVVADNPLGPYSEGGDRARVLSGIPGHVRGPGHHSIVTGPDGQTQYVLYHAWDAGMTQRELCLDVLQWTDAGPRCTPTDSPQPMPKVRSSVLK